MGALLFAGTFHSSIEYVKIDSVLTGFPKTEHKHMFKDPHVRIKQQFPT